MKKTESMKKFILITAIGCFISLAGFAQAKPYYTQYILNNYILNPAITGIENYTDVKLSYRNQWAGITGAPVTTYFSIQGPLGRSDNASLTAARDDERGFALALLEGVALACAAFARIVDGAADLVEELDPLGSG